MRDSLASRDAPRPSPVARWFDDDAMDDPLGHWSEVR